MNRILRTNAIPRVLPDEVDGARFITLQPAAAGALGVSHCSLNALAREVLRKAGITVADAVFARQTLKSVISRIYPDTDPSSIAARIGEVLSTMLRTGIDAEILIEQGSKRTRDVGLVARNYRAALHQAGRIDRNEILLEAAGRTPERQRLLIYGYHRARKEEIHFIDSIAGDGSVCFLPVTDDAIFNVNRDWLGFLENNGWRIDDAGAAPRSVGEGLGQRFLGAGKLIADIRATEYPNIESEIRGVLSEVKQLVVSGTDVRQIAVVCRDQGLYADMVTSVAAEYRLPVVTRHNVRLANTAFGGFVRVLLTAAVEFNYESVARLVRHPFGPGLNERDWATVRKNRASGRDAWTAFQPALDKVIWPASQPLGLWISGLMSAFDAFDVRRKAAARPRESLAYDKFFAALYAVNRLDGGRALTLVEFAGLAAEVLADEAVRFQPSAAGVAVRSPDEILGAEFAHLFIVGMAEGILPSPVTEDTAIDFFERKILLGHGAEFAEAAELARWEELSFYFTLLAGRQEVSLSYPATVDNGERVASSYFDRLGIVPAKAALTEVTVSSVEERRTILLRHVGVPGDDATLRSARHQHAVESRRESSAPYDEYDGMVGAAIDPAGRRWSVSQLTTIGQCRFRWFAQQILRLKPVDEIDPGMDYRKRGTFYHRVLEIAVRRAMDEPDIRAGTLRNLDAAFADAEADPQIDRPMLSNWDLQRTEHIRALRKAVEAADFISDGSRVVGLEQEFNLEWQGFRMKGYIDRVDETPDGLIAIDYKTSSKPPYGAKDETGRLSIDLQIPIYSNVALRHLYPQGKLGNSLYYSLTKGTILRQEKDDDFPKLEAFVKKVKLDLAAGNFAVDPDVNFDACTYCQFDAVCRKGTRLDRKNNQ